MRRTVLVLVLALATAVGGACAAPAPPAVEAPPFPQPAGTRIEPATPGVGPDTSCDPTASLAPTGPPPPPGTAAPGSTVAAILARGVLSVGVDQNTFPFGYRDPATGELAGFDVALARELARALFGDPNRVRFRVESSGQRIPNLLSGAVDVVVQTMTTSCERRRQIAFSSVYFAADQRVLVPRASPVRELSGLGGARVCSIAGSTSARTLQAAVPSPVTVTVPEKSDCLVLLQQDQVAAISTDDTILSGFAAEDPTLELRGPAVAVEPYAIGVAPQHEDLVRWVNAVLDRVRADGTYSRLLATTVPPTVVGPGTPPPPARYRPEP